MAEEVFHPGFPGAARIGGISPQSDAASLRRFRLSFPQESLENRRRPMTTASRFATYFHVHLVSDSTGETLNAMARAVCARFDNVLPIEHIYALVRSPRQLERALTDIEAAPGVVIHTIVDDQLRSALEEGCRRLDMTCIAALDPLVSSLSRYLGASISRRVDSASWP